MSAVQRHPPRYVPVLTEVVEDGSPLSLSPATPPDADLLADQVMARLEPLLARRLDDLMARVVQEQSAFQLAALLPELSTKVTMSLRPELEGLVAQAVRQMLDSWPPNKTE